MRERKDLDQIALLNDRFQNTFQSMDCVIIAGGPSVRMVCIERLAYNNIIAVNVVNYLNEFQCIRNAFVAGVVLDAELIDKIRCFSTRRIEYPLFTCAAPSDSVYDYVRDASENIFRIPTAERTCPLAVDYDAFNFGGNSGFAALQVAVIMGFKLIGILGYDGIARPNDRINFHNEYAASTNPEALVSWCTLLDDKSEYLRSIGVELINLSPISILNAYKRMNIEEWNIYRNSGTRQRHKAMSYISTEHGMDALNKDILRRKNKYAIKWSRNVLYREAVMVIVDVWREEWLQIWWDYYALYNAHPVLFVDCNMSEKAKRWCTKHGDLIEYKYPRSTSDNYLQPIAILSTTAEKTLWLDVHCEVMGNVSQLFSLLDAYNCVVKDDSPYVRHVGLPTTLKGVYNSGIVLTVHGADIITEWAKRMINGDKEYRNDQIALSHVIVELHTHRGFDIGNQVLDEQFMLQREGPVRCREKLGGLIKEYYREAA